MKILIAEDDELILRTIEHKLVNEGFEVITSDNGKKAIEIIKTTHPDVVITDIMMPFASGIEILTAIQHLGINPTTIVLSSLGQEDIVEEAFLLGASDYMIKPFNPNELVLRIKRLVRVNR